MDILKKFNFAIQAYRSHNYFDFGEFLGEAFDEIVRTNTTRKNIRDEQAYEFFCGYMDGLLKEPIERVYIYNKIDQMGALLMEPVDKVV